MFMLSWVETTDTFKFKPVVQLFDAREEAQAITDAVYEKIEYGIENSDTSESNIVSELYVEEINITKIKRKKNPPSQR